MTRTLRTSRTCRLSTAGGLLALVLAAAPAAAGPAAAAPAAPAASAAVALTPAAAAAAGDGATAARLQTLTQDRSSAARPQLNRQEQPTPRAVIGSSLERGGTLAPGDSLVSPSKQYSLVMEDDGDVVLSKAANRLNPNPYEIILYSGEAGSRLVFQTDGNVVLYGPDNTAYEQFGTAGTNAQSLRMQDDGNVVVYGPDNSVVSDQETSDFSFLFDGGTLLPGEALRSDDGVDVLLMQPDGNLVLYSGGVARFATGTSVPGSGAVLQADGNLVVYSPDNRPLFSTSTSSSGFDYVVFELDGGEGRLFGVPTDVAVAPVLFGTAWATSVIQPGAVLLPGDRRTAPGNVVLVLQTDGNLVQYVNGRAVFATRTRADFGSVGIMQPDGNFVLYAFDEDDDVRPVFSTRSAGNPGSRFVVQSDGNAVVYTPTNRPVFATRR